MNPFGLIAQLENSRISLPLEHVEARFQVTGDLASVELDQVYQQNAREALDVTEGGAVHDDDEVRPGQQLDVDLLRGAAQLEAGCCRCALHARVRRCAHVPVAGPR
jgi:hypothetical protein